MAEILIRAVDNDGSGPGVYKRGDPVVLVEDGYTWGPGENPSKDFYLLKIPGEPAAILERYLRPVLSNVHIPSDVMLKRRGYKVDLQQLSFDAQRVAIINASQISQVFVKKP